MNVDECMKVHVDGLMSMYVDGWMCMMWMDGCEVWCEDDFWMQMYVYFFLDV